MTQTIAIAIPALNSWYSGKLMAGAHELLASEDYETVVAVVSEAASLSNILENANPRTGRVDGIIIVDMDLPATMVSELCEAGTRIVTTGRTLPQFPSVMIDDVAASRAATAHVIGLGHRHLGLISGNSDGPFRFNVTDRRRQGFFEAVAEADVEIVVDEAVGNFALDGGYEAASMLVQPDAPSPTALVCMSDEMAFGAVRSLQDRGLSVPESVSVIGFDDQEIAETFALTTIRQPVGEIGAVAAALMISLLTDDQPSIEHEILDFDLVVRQTTRRRSP